MAIREARGTREELLEGLKAGFAAEFGNTRKVRVGEKGEVLEQGNTQVKQLQEKGRQPHRTPAPAPTGGAGFIYGDGNVAMQGDLVECAGDIAEVKTVANNGVVLEVPNIGMKVVDGSGLLNYKRIGNRNRAK